MANVTLNTVQLRLLPSKASTGGLGLPPVADTTTNKKGTVLLETFKQEKTMYVNAPSAGAPYYLVPFHSVEYVMVTKSSADIDFPDSLGCDEE